MWNRRRKVKRSLARQAIDAVLPARRVYRQTGKSVFAQFMEMARLIQLPNRVTPDEYFAMRLFDDTALDWTAKREFLGKRAKPHIYKVNHPAWQALADDKLACLAELTAFGLPAPRTVAVHGLDRSLPGATPLAGLEDVAEFLRTDAAYPLFSKPNTGTLGRSAYAISGYRAASDELILKNGATLQLDSYLDVLKRVSGGTIFQELVAPHPDVRAVCGDRLATVRLLVLNRVPHPLVHRAVWRIPVGANMVDNFTHGQRGNLLASVDPETGRLRRVVGGIGFEMRTVDRHPDTGQSFAGVTLPDWPRVLDVCGAATRVVSGMGIQGWDVAVSDRGPLLMEVNFQGDLDLIQIADGAGVADEVWRRFIAAS